jgi:hypothetical protein
MSRLLTMTMREPWTQVLDLETQNRIETAECFRNTERLGIESIQNLYRLNSDSMQEANTDDQCNGERQSMRKVQGPGKR